jgi:ubiquinone/menaquinone biosynthesis C-methylase UbiE
MFQVPAQAYDRWIGRYSPQLAAALIEFAGIEPELKALDVGCGPGALSSALVGRVGASNVYAVDPSEPFVEACRQRLPGVNAIVASAESLPFPDDEFDAALAQLVVNFMSDPEAGVREMARVTRAGGVVAACVWDYGGEMTLLRAFWESAREVEPARGEAGDEAKVMKWSGEGDLAELWQRAGLTDVRFDALHVSASYDSFDDLWAPLESGVAPPGAFYKSLDEDGRAALYETFRRRLSVGDGPFELTARAWAAAGTVAAS